ncbi:hypothetical protein CYY_001673 [Polysphondylium violaceum]|uniref:Uncharacterized protein n=1 Tax=Polysphondylium violaceum TaxID=133409 RepID=A0A8J4UW03_9MYCE|nr:hypothetical protein CYY_001673 [Polysphondylium violaceum]
MVIPGDNKKSSSGLIIFIAVWSAIVACLLLWRITYNIALKKNRYFKEIIHIGLVVFLIFTCGLYSSLGWAMNDSSLNPKTLSVLVQTSLVVQLYRYFIPFAYFFLIILLLNYWIGIYIDIFQIRNGHIFTRYTKPTFIAAVIPLVILFILNIVSFTKKLKFKARVAIESISFYLPILIVLGLSLFIFAYSIYLLISLQKNPFRARMYKLVIRFSIVTLTIIVSVILNIANYVYGGLILPSQLYTVFMLITCTQIGFIIYPDFDFLCLPILVRLSKSICSLLFGKKRSTSTSSFEKESGISMEMSSSCSAINSAGPRSPNTIANSNNNNSGKKDNGASQDSSDVQTFIDMAEFESVDINSSCGDLKQHNSMLSSSVSTCSAAPASDKVPTSGTGDS